MSGAQAVGGERSATYERGGVSGRERDGVVAQHHSQGIGRARGAQEESASPIDTRTRQKGRGRKRLSETDAGLAQALDRGAKVIALLGGNGAGKTTTMRAIMGLIRVQSGSIEFNGSHIEHWPPHQIIARGLSLVPQGRELFSEMTVAENLELGSLQRGDGRYQDRLGRVLDFFSNSQGQLRQRAGMLSGGQQQMLATARALMSDPELLLLDEPSIGLSPLVVDDLRRIIERLKGEGRTILLVEQNIRLAPVCVNVT